MPSVTTWTRLEPRTRTDLSESALEARVTDPLWFLARQWQFGELQGEDAGSPIGARLRGEISRLSRYHPGPLPVTNTALIERYNHKLPLETLVERESVRATDAEAESLQTAVDAGLHFLRLLGPGLAKKYRNAYRSRYPFDALPPIEREALDRESLNFWNLIAPRSINGASLYADLATALRPGGGGTPSLPALPAIEPGDVETVSAAANRYLAWYEGAFSQSANGNFSWQRERLEYAFAVASEKRGIETVMVAAEYAGGRLDWHSFNLAPGATLPPPDTAAEEPLPEPLTVHLIPSPVEYYGMPAPRWWEFEDGRVNLGAVDAGPADLARLLLLEFALIYGNDWFAIPVEMRIGSLFDASSLVVTDTFGVRTLIAPSARAQRPGENFRLFELTGATDRANPFFLAPALVNSLHGEPIEDVLFLRDEMANMAWGIERKTESRAGRVTDRMSEYYLRREQRARADEEAIPKPEERDATLQYRLSSEVPEPWIPLIPQQISPGSRSIRLRRGAILLPDGSMRLATAQGRILGGATLALFEEEVPRAGVRVTRAWQLARWVDGSTHSWVGRRKQPGRGEGSSGLRFDTAES
ncbi:MAG: hypothetical protein ACKVX9_14690 [Blastocatellia bacterium]